MSPGNIISIVFLVVPLMACVYYLALALVAFTHRGCRDHLPATSEHRFAIVIPAHNESDNIAETLVSCREIDYPADKYAVIVVADNCTDDTAAIVRSFGYSCLERHDTDRRGKGYALEFAFNQLLREDYDVFVVVDADCAIDDNALRVIDHEMQHGTRVVQLNYVASNPDDSAISYATCIANYLENELFFAPKSALKLAVFLRGTGMAIHRNILRQLPWTSSSIVEDLDYSMELLRRGHSIEYVTESRVCSRFPIHGSQLEVQRNRWITGGLHICRNESVKLITTGLAARRISLIDAGWTLLVQSRVLMFCSMCAAIVVSAMNHWCSGTATSKTLFLVSVTIALGCLTYLLLGVLGLGISWRRFGFLLRLPFVGLQWFGVAFKSMMMSKTGLAHWDRTPRPSSTA